MPRLSVGWGPFRVSAGHWLHRRRPGTRRRSSPAPGPLAKTVGVTALVAIFALVGHIWWLAAVALVIGAVAAWLVYAMRE